MLIERQKRLFALQDVGALLLDLGVSSYQLDTAERGFSFMRDGPLDMRMGRSGPSAADVVNQMDERDLATIFFRLGEEKQSRRIARAIVQRRLKAPFTTTLDLAISLILFNCQQKRIGPREIGHEHEATRFSRKGKPVHQIDLSLLFTSLCMCAFTHQTRAAACPR